MIKKWSLVIIWMGIIFGVSSIHIMRVSQGMGDLVLSNIAHFIEFFVLNLLLFRALKGSTGWRTPKAIATSCVFSLIYAFLDEFHQSFVPTRFPSLIDLFVDTLGILLFAGLVIKGCKQSKE